MRRGIASFALLRDRPRDKQAFVGRSGEDLRELPLERRKGEPCSSAPFGPALNDYVAGEDPALFVQGCAALRIEDWIF